MAKAKKKAKTARKRKTTKEVQKELIDNMETWKKVENASIASTGRVIEKTENPVVRLVMEIIQRDSQMHYRVQDWIVQSLQKSVSLTTDEIGQVWKLIEDHIKIEKKTQKLAEEALESTKVSKGMLVQTYLLEYLLEDEKKHAILLERLAGIQKGMYPYG
jgi:nitrate/TMAO reductase-like tetraheme cytochrome c subunit